VTRDERLRRVVPISLVWLFYLGGLGLFFPFYSLYLRENVGLSGTEVGSVLAVLPLVGVFAQPVWGQIADRTGSRARVLVVLGLGASTGYAGLLLGRGFGSMLLLTALLACFAAAFVPNAVAVTLAVTRDVSRHAFGLSRVWGTIGFLICVVSFPGLLDAFESRRGLVPVPGGPSQPGLFLMFPLTGSLALLAALVAMAIPRLGSVAERAAPGDWRELATHTPYLRLLGFSLLAYFLLQGPMALFPIYVRAHGGSIDSVSRMWVLMLTLEIPLVALSGASLERLGPRGLLAVGVAAGGVRWTLCGLAPGSAWVYPAQLLHGVTVAGLVIGAPLYVEAAVPGRLRSTGQGVLAMVGMGAGAILSNLAAGWLLEHRGAAAPYVAGGVGALALAALIPVILPTPHRPGAPGSARPA
jgi:PPP family 3-phenylpropionic acid transporter